MDFYIRCVEISKSCMFFEIKFFFYGMYWQNKDNNDGYVKIILSLF